MEDFENISWKLFNSSDAPCWVMGHVSSGYSTWWGEGG